MDERCFVLVVARDLPVFEDHFPGSPILPAFVELGEAIDCARRAWPDLGPWVGASALKFTAPIGPGAELVLCLGRTPSARQVTFSLSCDDTPCASGTLAFAPEASP